MKDLIKLLFALFIMLNPLAQLVAQINAGADVNVCMGETVTLSAVATGGFGTDSYSFEVYNYQPESYTGGTPVTFPGNQDDQIAGPFPIGFQFCFFNNYYSEFYIGTNGWVGFTNDASWTTYTSQAIPSTNAAVPKNCIMAPWQDWYPGSSASPVVFYKISGTAPNRKLVVYWDQCPMFSCTTEYGTFQIVLNEQSSIVENHLTNKPNCTWAGGTATQGVHNSDGTVAFTATGRNSTAWTTSNESTRFVPSGIKWYTNYPNGAIVGYGPDLTITPTTTTTYTAVVNMCGGQVFTDDVTVFVLPADDATFSYGTSTFCRSGFSGPPSASFPGGTYTAIPAGLNIDPATGDIDLASSIAGTYTVTHTTNGSCPDTESIVLTVVNSPSATFSYPSPVYCMAAANPLPVFPSGSSAGTFTSSPAGLVFTDALTGEINLSASVPGTYTITNTIPPWGACPQVSYSTTIGLTFVSADFNYPLNAYCTTSENPVPVFATGATAGNFSASPSGLVFVSALTGEINLAASAQGHYVVTNTIAASASCPEVSHATNIEIVSISAVFSYPLSSYCSNLPNPLPQFPPGSSSGTYTATPAGLVFVNPGTGQINLSASAPGVYTVTNTIPPWAACPEVSYSTTVEILPAPPIATIPQGPEILCQNPPDTEYATTPLANTTSYNWTLTPQAAGVISGTGITAIVNWNNQFTGLANIVVRGNNSCGNGLASPPLVVDINAGPGLPARPTGPVLHCQGPGITDYSTSGSSGAATYEWQLLPSSAGSLSINGPHASITWSASFSGLAQLSVRGINTCGTSSWSAPLEIDVVPALMAPAQPQGPALFCTGGTTGSYSTELISNANSYHWVLNPANAGAITGSSNVAVIEWSAGFSGSATLKVAGQNECGSGPFSPVLEIFVANPIQASAGNDTTVNLGATIILKGSVDGSPQSLQYHWEPAALLVNADVLQPVTLPLINATVFSLLITNTDTGCTSGDEVLVIVEGASLSAQVTGSPLSICLGSTAQLSVQAYGGIVGNYQYSWSLDGVVFSNLQTIEVNPGNTSTYHVDVYDGNSTVSASITVEVWPIPIADAGTDQSINNGAFTQLSGAASGGQEPFSYQWSPADSLLNPNQQSPLTKKLSTTTLFFLTVTDAHGCTSQSDQVVVTVSGGLLSINPIASDPVVCFGDTTRLFALASGGNNTYYYTWKVGNEVISTEENPLVTPLATTTYSLQVYDTYNIATGAVTVQVDPLPGVNLIGPGVHYEGNTILACVFDTVSIVLNNPRASFLWSDGSTGNLMELSTSGFSFDLREIWVEVTDTLTGCRTRAEVNVSFTIVECSYGLDDLSKNDKLLLFPNPAGDKVIIRPVVFRNGDCLVQLFGITGNAISETSGHWSSEGIEINLENVAEGIYLLKVISDNETSILKLVVSK